MKRQKSENIDNNNNNNNNESGIIKLNVGGTKMITTMTTLNMYPKSSLSIMFTNDNTRNIITKIDEEYFIDTDPVIFAYILQRMRRKIINEPNPPSGIHLIDWLAELEYWLLIEKEEQEEQEKPTFLTIINKTKEKLLLNDQKAIDIIFSTQQYKEQTKKGISCPTIYIPARLFFIDAIDLTTYLINSIQRINQIITKEELGFNMTFTRCSKEKMFEEIYHENNERYTTSITTTVCVFIKLNE